MVTLVTPNFSVSYEPRVDKIILVSFEDNATRRAKVKNMCLLSFKTVEKNGQVQQFFVGHKIGFYKLCKTKHTAFHAV